MKVKEFSLAWIVVKDLDRAIAFYTQVLGMKLLQMEEEFGWAELAGECGATLGLAKENDIDQMKAGQNAIFTLNVDNIVSAKSELSKKGTRLIGDIVEIPGHVKMQMCVDTDGNHFQLAELLDGK